MSDYYEDVTDEIPDDVPEVEISQSFLESTEQITLDEIKTSLPEQDYQTLTIGDDKNGLHCLVTAKLRVKADIQSTGNLYDETVPEVRLALMKMWIYELYSFIGESEKAKSVYEDYYLIIKTSFGSIHTKGENQTEDTGPAVGFVSAPKRFTRGC